MIIPLKRKDTYHFLQGCYTIILNVILTCKGNAQRYFLRKHSKILRTLLGLGLIFSLIKLYDYPQRVLL